MASYYDQDDGTLSLMAIDQYMGFVGWTPLLTDEERRLLVERIEQGKAERRKACPDAEAVANGYDARDRLVEGYQRLVIHMARKYIRRFLSMELLDLIQEGNICLLEEIEKNDLRHVRALASWFAHAMKNSFVEALWTRDRMVRLPDYVWRAITHIRQARQELLQELGSSPSSAQIAQRVQIAADKVVELTVLCNRAEYVESIEAILQEEEFDEDELRVIALYEGKSEMDESGAIDLSETETSSEGIPSEIVKGLLQQVVETALTPRQRQVIQLRYGLDGQTDGERSYGEVAALLGCGVNCVSVADRQARDKLQRALAFFTLPFEQGRRRHGLPLVRPIEVEEFECLLKACASTQEGGSLTQEQAARSRALLWLLWETGIGLTQLRDLRFGDVDREQEAILIRGKGNRERRLALGENTLRALLLYIDSYRFDRQGLLESGKLDEEYIFLSKTGEPLTRFDINNLFYRLRKRAKLPEDRPINPQMLRYSFAVRSLMHGGDLLSLPELLGPEQVAFLKNGMHLSGIGGNRNARPALMAMKD